MAFERFLFETILSRRSRLLELLKDIKKLFFYYYSIIISILDNFKNNETNDFDGVYNDSPPKFNGTNLFPQWITSIFESEEGNLKLIQTYKIISVYLKKQLIKNNFTFLIKKL